MTIPDFQTVMRPILAMLADEDRHIRANSSSVGDPTGQISRSIWTSADVGIGFVPAL